MLPVILSFGAIDALVPLIIIIILIAAAGGLTRGFDMLKFFGIETLAGIGAGAAAKGSLLKKTAFTKKAGQALVGKGGKTTGKLYSPGKATASKINRTIARNAAFKKELETLGVKAAGNKQSRLLNMLKGFAVKLGGPTVKAGRVVAPVSVLGGVAGAKAVAAGTRAGIRALRGRRRSRQKVNVTNLGMAAGPTPFSNELNNLKGKSGNNRVLNRRVELLQKSEQELQAARARFLQTGDIGEYRKEFNRLWDKTHKGEPSLLRSAIMIAAATPGIIRSSSDERKARIQELNERLEGRMATKTILEEPSENAPKVTQFSTGGFRGGISAARESIRSAFERRQKKTEDFLERKKAAIDNRIVDNRLVDFNRKVEEKLSRLRKRNAKKS
jgi:hypothetical protein